MWGVTHANQRHGEISAARFILYYRAGIKINDTPSNY